MADSTARSLSGGSRTRFALVAKYPKSSPPAIFVDRLRRSTREAARKRPEFPGERLSFVGREAFGGKRSNEARHHPEREAALRAANSEQMRVAALSRWRAA
jgi:hypothetical protein